MSTNPNVPTSLEVKREERERRDARDRVLAREVGIEIGKRRAELRHERQKQRVFWRGFILGVVFTIILLVLFWYPARDIQASTIMAPKNQQTLGAKHEPRMPARSVIEAIVKVGQCEQPAPRGAGYWRDIRWDAYPGKTWPGGLGIMQIHHDQFRPKGTPADPTKATPAQQIRVAWRAYKHYRRIYGIGGGATFWVCSAKVGFGGVLMDNKTVVWR